MPIVANYFDNRLVDHFDSSNSNIAAFFLVLCNKKLNLIEDITFGFSKLWFCHNFSDIL